MIFEIILLFIVLLILSIPLYFSVKLLNGNVTVLKAAFINLVLGGLFIILGLINYGSANVKNIIAFVLMLFVYRISFKIGFLKSFFVWILQGILFVLLFFGVLLILGFSIL